jgi:hypothetical protein
MTIAPKRLARPLRLALLTIAPGTACLAAPALADTRTSLDLAAGGMYDSNPFLADDSGGDVAVTLQATPRLQISDNVSSLNILGDFLVRQFVKSANGSDITGTASVAGTHRASPFFTINAGANYLTSSNGLNLGFSNVRPDDPLPPPTTPLPDITLGGTRTRTHMVSGNAGFSLRASPRDMIGANVTAARNFFDGDGGLGARDFSFINGGLNYSRTLSRRVAATAAIRYGKSNFIGTNLGDGTIITPEAGIDMTLDERTTLSASLGASFTRTSLADGTIVKGTALSGQARVCRTLPNGGACLVAARSAQPTALGSVSVITSVAANYDRRLSARDTMTLSLAFNSSDDDLTLATGTQEAKLYSAGGNWSRSLNRRLFMFVAPSYSRITDPSRSFDSFRLSVGLRLSLGAT